jgi:hypothetical protein
MRGYKTGQRLPDRDPTPPEANDEPLPEPNPAIDEDQLASLQVSADGSTGWMVHEFGTLGELSPRGRAEVRWLWDNRPDLRESFGVEPPASWATDP